MYKSVLLVSLLIELSFIVYLAHRIDLGQDITLSWVLISINALGGLLAIKGILK